VNSLACLVHEFTARIGQFDLAGAADEQRNFQVALKLTNGAAESGLGEMKPSGGLGEVQFFGKDI